MEPIQEFRISPENRRICGYVIVGAALCGLIAAGIDQGRSKSLLDYFLNGLVFGSVILAASYALRWRLRVTPEGLARRQFLHWDFWPYAAMRQGSTVQLPNRTTLYDASRPWWCRRLGFEGLSAEDLGKIQLLTSAAHLHDQTILPGKGDAFKVHAGVVFFFSMIGFALANCGWWLGWQVGVLCCCAAPAWFIVASAYGGLGSRVFGKRTDGTHALYSRILLAPYLWVNGLVFTLYALSSREPATAELQPGLCFGRRLFNREVPNAIRSDCAGVLDLAGEFSEVSALRTIPGYRSLPILDSTAPSLSELQSATHWLRESMSRGSVYVHCALGHGRTGTVVIAYLLAERLVDNWEQGLERLRALRAGVNLNRTQIQCLVDWTAIVSDPANSATPSDENPK